MTLYLLGLAVNGEISEDNINFGAYLEFKICLFVSIIASLYFQTQPNIFFDQDKLLVKRLGQKIFTIPLEKIDSIFSNPLSVNGGDQNYTVDYLDNNNVISTYTFRARYSSKSTEKFIESVKKRNPGVKITV